MEQGLGAASGELLLLGGGELYTDALRWNVSEGSSRSQKRRTEAVVSKADETHEKKVGFAKKKKKVNVWLRRIDVGCFEHEQGHGG